MHLPKLAAWFGPMLLAVALAGCAEDRTSAWVPPPVVVESQPVAVQTYRPQLTLAGSLEAAQETLVAAEVSGLVSRLSFESGAWVERGDLLLQLNSDVELAEVARYQAQYELSQKELARAQKLKGLGASQSRIDTLKKELDESAAHIAWLEAIVSKKQILAPFSGRLGVSRVHLGQYLAPGSAIVTLTNDTQFYVDFAVPERYLKNIKAGDFIAVAQDELPIGQAVVLAVDPQLDERARVARVRAALPERLENLHSGMYVSVSLPLAEYPNALMLPSASVSSSTVGDAVFVLEQVDGEWIARRRAITIADRPNDWVRVAQGLTPGERVVTSGQHRLRDGARVQLNETDSAPLHAANH